MESTKAKYKIGTRVKYKLDNPNFNVQYGTIAASYYSSYSDKVYYTVSKDDGGSAEVPEEIIVVRRTNMPAINNKTKQLKKVPKYKINDNVLFKDKNNDILHGKIINIEKIRNFIVYSVLSIPANGCIYRTTERFIQLDNTINDRPNVIINDNEEDYGDEG